MVAVAGKPRYRASADGTFKQIVGVDTLRPTAFAGGGSLSTFDGDKFPGGFGETQLFTADYWTLRKRSAQLFTENLYARGLIRRLVTNEINTGLMPEACPDEGILGVPEDSLNDWTESTENRFTVYARGPTLCDWRGVHTFGAIQAMARTEALVEGDVLIVLRQSPLFRLPQIELILGSRVRTPHAELDSLRRGHEVKHGIEKNADGNVVAHWVTKKDGTSERVPRVGARTGRRVSWMLYGTDKRMDAVRGEPLLSLVLQSLKEIDRYRDSAQRKAVINSILAMFIKKTEDKLGSLPMQNAAVRKDAVPVTDGDGSERTFNIEQQLPGVVLEELQVGEEPVGFSSAGTDVDFGVFEAAIMQTVAWANEVPPEILMLAFSNNYSASQAAINEFKIYLNKIWGRMGDEFCTPIYIEWLISESLSGKIDAPGLLDSWRDAVRYDEFGAWTLVDWYGSIKPSTDMLKQVKGSELLCEGGYSTRAREARITTGTKYAKNVKRLRHENKLLAEARRPILEQQAEFGADATSTATTALAEALDMMGGRT